MIHIKKIKKSCYIHFHYLYDFRKIFLKKRKKTASLIEKTCRLCYFKLNG